MTMVATSLREYRKMLGLTQQQVADRMGVPQNRISGIEQQQNMRLKTLRRYVRGTGGELLVTANMEDGRVFVLDLWPEEEEE